VDSCIEAPTVYKTSYIGFILAFASSIHNKLPSQFRSLLARCHTRAPTRQSCDANVGFPRVFFENEDSNAVLHSSELSDQLVATLKTSKMVNIALTWVPDVKRFNQIKIKAIQSNKNHDVYSDVFNSKRKCTADYFLLQLTGKCNPFSFFRTGVSNSYRAVQWYLCGHLTAYASRYVKH
jgi:hypothetical protein